MMTMLNTAHVEAICSATYLEDYLDCLDALPDELQRILTQIREIDVRLNELEKDTAPFEDMFSNLKDGELPDSRFLGQVQRTLLRMQEFEDEKIQLSGSLMEFIENRTKQLEADRENLDPANHMVNENTTSSRSNSSNNKKSMTADAKASAAQTSTSSHSVDNIKQENKQADSRVATNSAKKRKQKQPEPPAVSNNKASVSQAKTPQPSNASASHAGSTSASTAKDKVHEDHTPAKKAAITSNSASKEREEESRSASKLPPKRKRRSRVGSQAKNQKEIVKEPSPEPEEPTYCLCNQISYGEMIGCDNDACPIEWFHFNCVNLNNKPKGKWYCPKCRGDKPTVMKRHR